MILVDVVANFIGIFLCPFIGDSRRIIIFKKKKKTSSRNPLNIVLAYMQNMILILILTINHKQYPILKNM